MFRLGVHCSVRKGLVSGLEEAHRLSCTTLQIFTRSPRMWRAGKIDPDDAAAFRQRRRELDLSPVVVHTPYLPNLCTTVEPLYARSYRAIVEDLEHCNLLDAEFYVIHPGAYSEGSSPDEAIHRMTDAINRAFSFAPGKTVLLLENMAGGGRRLGATFEQLAQMLSGISDRERVGLCLDTAHALGAGYGFSTPAEVAETLSIIDRTIGLNRLRVIHANDSRAARGSHRDLHEHIGRGGIGLEAFRALLQDSRLRNPAVILETPKDSTLADETNLRVLRQLASGRIPGESEGFS